MIMSRPSDTAIGWMFVGAYACLAIGAYAMFSSASDMGGLVIVVFALPWSAVGGAAAGSDGLVFGTYGGLALNAVAAFLLGRYIWPSVARRMRARMNETERFRERQEQVDQS
jgi:hypothetical protein